jgi:hypothetical protein
MFSQRSWNKTLTLLQIKNAMLVLLSEASENVLILYTVNIALQAKINKDKE